MSLLLYLLGGLGGLGIGTVVLFMLLSKLMLVKYRTD